MSGKSVKKPTRPVALVTGSGRRLGRQIALALAKNGYNIVVNYNTSEAQARSTVRRIKTLGVTAIGIKADVSSSSEVRRMVGEAADRFGRIDLLVNSSAVFTESGLLDTTEENWSRTLDINLKGVFLCSQAVALIMLKQKKGRIINIASLGGLQAWKNHLPYSVSKAGVIMLTRIMAKTLAPNIPVNAIAPGTIIIEGEEDPALAHVPVKTIPLGRYGKPDDITSAVLFLAKDANYMTGQILIVDGGRSITH